MFFLRSQAHHSGRILFRSDQLEFFGRHMFRLYLARREIDICVKETSASILFSPISAKEFDGRLISPLLYHSHQLCLFNLYLAVFRTS